MPSRPIAVLLSTHPGPTVVVTTITVSLGATIGLPLATLVILGFVMLLNQASVGLSNDWIDSERDIAVGRRDKPVARGWVSARTIRTVAFVAAGASLLGAFALGVPAGLVHLVILASAWSYNLGLKNSVLSVAPYLVSFGLLPLMVTLVVPALAAIWAVIAGALLGVAAHFANVLPDLDDDRRTGIRGLPHRLGRRTAGVLTFVALSAASGAVVWGAGVWVSPIGWVAAATSLAISAWGIYLVLEKPPTRALFRLIIAAALLTVALLATSGAELVV